MNVKLNPDNNIKQNSIIGFTILLTLIAYYLGLFIDLTGDAGKYAAVTRHIVESGDYINLKIHGDAYDQKPPLLFWLSAIGFKFWGLHNWTYKLLPLLYSFAGIYFTYQLGKTLYNKKSGLLAATFLCTSEIYFLYTMDVHTDLVLQTNVTLAIWQLALYLKEQKRVNFIFAFVGVGLAMMSKGAIGAAIPAFALLTHLLAKRDFTQLFHLKWFLGIVIAMITAIPAFLGLMNQFGIEGIKFFFITNNVGRITGEYAGNNTDLFFYVHSLLYLFLPWTAPLAMGIFMEFKQIFKEGQAKSEFLTTGGIWIFFLIASVSKGKAPHYIFMLIPMIAVLTAKWTVYLIENGNTRKIRSLCNAQNLVDLALCLFIGLAMFYLFPSEHFIYTILFLLSAIICVWTLFSRLNIYYRLVVPGAILISFFNLYMNASALPYAFSHQASAKASRIFNGAASEDEKLYNYLYGQYELFFYAKTNADQLHSLNELRQALPGEKFWVFTNQIGLDSIRSCKQISIIENYPLKNRGMNKAGIKFILPKTREKSLSRMYLLKAEKN